MYTDNSKLIGPVDTQKGVASIQSDPDNFDESAKIWKLKFDVQKGKVPHFGRKQPITTIFDVAECWCDTTSFQKYLRKRSGGHCKGKT
jgi:hypothetical protein